MARVHGRIGYIYGPLSKIWANVDEERLELEGKQKQKEEEVEGMDYFQNSVICQEQETSFHHPQLRGRGKIYFKSFSNFPLSQQPRDITTKRIPQSTPIDKEGCSRKIFQIFQQQEE